MDLAKYGSILYYSHIIKVEVSNVNMNPMGGASFLIQHEQLHASKPMRSF